MESKSDSNCNNHNHLANVGTCDTTGSRSRSVTTTRKSVQFKIGSSADIGHYRLQKVLNHLEGMATLPSPRSPKWNQALYSPIQSLPTTRFPNADERYDFEQLHEIMLETEKERETIHNQVRIQPLGDFFPGTFPTSNVLTFVLIYSLTEQLN